jgi:hypothetical protein
VTADRSITTPKEPAPQADRLPGVRGRNVDRSLASDCDYERRGIGVASH